MFAHHRLPPIFHLIIDILGIQQQAISRSKRLPNQFTTLSIDSAPTTPTALSINHHAKERNLSHKAAPGTATTLDIIIIYPIVLYDTNTTSAPDQISDIMDPFNAIRNLITVQLNCNFLLNCHQYHIFLVHKNWHWNQVQMDIVLLHRQLQHGIAKLIVLIKQITNDIFYIYYIYFAIKLMELFMHQD